MLKFLIGAIIIIVALLGLSYGPSLWKRRQITIARRVFNERLEAMNNAGDWDNFVLTDRLGEGGSRNSGPKFADTQKNQEIATDSVLRLIRRYMG